MKNTVITRIICLTLTVLLALSLFSCKKEETPSADGSGDGPAPSAETIDYTVSVKDHAGNAVPDAVVSVMKGEEKVKMNFTNPKGVAKFSLESGNYTFTIETSDKTPYEYDISACTLSADKPSAEITVYNIKMPSEDLYFVIDEVDVICKSYTASVGGNHASLTAGEPYYFVFTPTQSGYYKISASEGARVGYHGSPNFPMVNNVADMESDGAFHLNIKDDNIGHNGTGTAQYIISVSADTDLSCVLKIVREDNYVRDIIDEPWQDIMPSKALTPFVPSSPINENNLVNIDLTDPSLTIVFNESDGYYHLGSATGPLVLVRISSESDYIASFTEMCETDRLGAYIYDENGKFLRKESFNDLIAAYAEICDEVCGVCPLDKDLENMIKTVGGYKGWWNFSSGNHIFGDSVVPEANAWLFACCYVAAN